MKRKKSYCIGFLAFLFLAPWLRAEILYLSDGTVLRGEITGEMEGAILLETKYGSLTIGKEDIIKMEKEKKPGSGPVISTHTFKTVKTSSGEICEIYMKKGVVVATKTFLLNGGVRIEGDMEDAVYTQYYEDGSPKIEMEIKDGKRNGVFKTYFPGQILESKTQYKDGRLDGKLEIYGKGGKIVLEQNFKNSLPDGYFRMYDEDGNVKSEEYYVQGVLAGAPSAQEAGAKKATEEKSEKVQQPPLSSLITAKRMNLARGERYLFYQNDKYIGKLILDKRFNVISKSGKIPDGIVNSYSADGEIERSITFISNNPIYIRIYSDGRVKEEYSYMKDRAIKKK